jgi:coenzyme F420-reducing hydrogenase gamma subunit
MKRPRVAFFDFTSCEGCQLQVANMGETLLEILSLIDLVEFRETMSEKAAQYDLAVVEGSITTAPDVERIKKIRDSAKILIAYGACATIGGLNAMKNNFNLEEIKKHVYAEGARYFDTRPTQPLHQVVPVDYFVNGCPVYLPEFVKVLKAALLGIPYAVPNCAVCQECKFNENVCLFERGVTCLGPITRSGCNSWCINNGNICYGCRGMVSNPAKDGQMEILKKYQIPLDWIMNKFEMYNKVRGLEVSQNGQKH